MSMVMSPLVRCYYDRVCLPMTQRIYNLKRHLFEFVNEPLCTMIMASVRMGCRRSVYNPEPWFSSHHQLITLSCTLSSSKCDDDGFQ
jgi:hypothetical protein